MQSTSRITLTGVPGSPYTRKMLALLRYRRIAYDLVLASHEAIAARAAAGWPRAKVNLLPTFYLPGPDGALQAVTDSTPILRRLEAEHPDRRARPADPALAFLDALIEDYGDEWLTKAMFHYRWAYDADAGHAARILPAWTRGRGSDAELAVMGEEIRDRQVARLRYVGSNETTGPVIEASYLRFLDLMEAHLAAHPFLLGKRPGAGDFALFGQLTQLAHFDPTPTALTAKRAPRVHAWTSAAEDLSGLEPAEDHWFDAAALPDTARALFGEIGRVYAPLLLANAQAVRSGVAEVRAEIDGRPWVQQTFAYHAKCLAWLQAEYDVLAPDRREVVDRALAGTGCERLFAAAARTP
jgi:glutathione S-transferase